MEVFSFSFSLAASLVALSEDLHALKTTSNKGKKRLRIFSKERHGTPVQVQDVLHCLDEGVERLQSLESRRQQKPAPGSDRGQEIAEIHEALEKILNSAERLTMILQHSDDINITQKTSTKLMERWLRQSSELEKQPSLKQRAYLLQNTIFRARDALLGKELLQNQSANSMAMNELPEPLQSTSTSKRSVLTRNIIRKQETIELVSPPRSQVSVGSSIAHSMSETSEDGLCKVQNRSSRLGLEHEFDRQVHSVVSKISKAWFDEELPPYWRRRDTYQMKRSECTCEWILEDPLYVQWLMSSGPGSSLCLSGKPGTGKSVLVASVIDDILDRDEAQNLLAYCFLGDGYLLSGIDIMLNLLSQICMATNIVPESIETLANMPVAPENALEVLTNVMLDICSMSESQHFIIVIDALDEANMTSRSEFDHVLDKLLLKTKCRVFISTRDEDPPFGKCIRLSDRMDHVSKDIMTMAGNTISNNKDAPAYTIVAKGESIHDRFSELLASHAADMFFWVDLKIRLVLPKISPYDARQIMKDLAVGVDAIAKLALEDVCQQPLSLRNMAQTTLLWLSQLQRPITIRALQDALAFKAQLTLGELPTIKSSNHSPTIEALRTCWKGLVHVDPTSHIVALADVQLRNVILEVWKDAEIPTLGETCIQYLTSKGISSLDFRTPAAMRSLCKRHQFLDYSGHAWINHAQILHRHQKEVQGSNDLRELVETLIKSQKSFHLALAISCFEHTKPYTSSQWEKVLISYRARPLLLVSALGLDPVVELILENAGSQAEFQLGITNDDSQTALHVAAINGHVQVVRLLVDAGASPLALDASNKTPLHYARENHYVEIFNVLFSCACRLWMQRKRRHPRQFLGDLPEYQDLLRYFGALHHVNQYKNSVQALSGAIDEGDVALAMAFICRGCDVNGSSDGLPILHHAILANQFQHYQALVKELLEAGADPSIREQVNALKSPLHIAARNGDVALTKLLLAYGADVDAVDNINRTALYYALEAPASDGVAIAELLLQHRTDIRGRDTEHDYQILHQAAVSGEELFVVTLLRHGADVKARASNKTPLDLAKENGRIEIVVCLEKANRSADRLTQLFTGGTGAPSIEVTVD